MLRARDPQRETKFSTRKLIQTKENFQNLRSWYFFLLYFIETRFSSHCSWNFLWNLLEEYWRLGATWMWETKYIQKNSNLKILQSVSFLRNWILGKNFILIVHVRKTYLLRSFLDVDLSSFHFAFCSWE